MASSPGDHQPAIRLSVREQLAFMRIVQHETNEAGRRMFDIWARPADTHPHADRILTETFRLLWRTPADPMER